MSVKSETQRADVEKRLFLNLFHPNDYAKYLKIFLFSIF